MKKLTIFLLLLNFASTQGYSQQIEINTKSLYGLWNNENGGYYYGGGSFELLYEHPLKKGALRGGIEFRTIDWGNQVTLNVGYKVPYIQKGNWSFSGITSAGFGLALFVDNLLFVYSVDYIPVFTWLRNKRMDFDIGLGIRFTNSPAYKNYGKINQLLELPLRIGMTYNLGYRKEPRSPGT